jgi:hypothetical protein
VLRRQLEPIDNTFQVVEVRLDLRDPLELDVVRLLQAGYSFAQSVEDSIPLVQDVNDAIVLAARHIGSVQRRPCELPRFGNRATLA